MEKEINNFYEIIQKEIINYFLVPKGKNEYLSYERINILIQDLVASLNSNGYFIYAKSINDEKRVINYNTVLSSPPKLFSFILLPQKLNIDLLNLCKKCTLLFSEIFDNIVCDLPFLLNALENIKGNDEFSKKIIDICEKVYLSKENGRNINNDIRCIIGRSDYMKHDGNLGNDSEIKQIEYNTISVAFGNLSSIIFEAHKNMIKEIYKEYFPYMTEQNKEEIFEILDKKFDNNFLQGISTCIEKSHNIYIENTNKLKNNKIVTICILHDDDINSFDKYQTKCELNKLGISQRYFTVKQLQNLFEKKKIFLNYTNETLNESIDRLINNINGCNEKNIRPGKLMINLNDDDINGNIFEQYKKNIFEVSVIYFRALYSPLHYNEIVWKLREMLEFSDAVKIPSLPYQLVGLKKIQMLLLDDEILRKYISIDLNKNKKSEEQILNDMSTLKKTFALQIDPSLNKHSDIISYAIKNENKFILKPQREGGQNNLHGNDVKEKLMLYYKPEEKNKLSFYVLMEKLFPSPFPTIHCRIKEINKNYEQKMNPLSEENQLQKKNSNYCDEENTQFIEFSLEQSISEFGFFHNIIFFKDKNILNEQKGYLVRTKNVNENEGGAICGISSLDSVFLV
ncbi:glutathione synthetase [Plasmodium berghei]|uniref:Glutathione synthetase n=2 Tax=Plasmodium berghei TaxID=5821 RepID=A0A509ANX2_PLABA|nr:glutathione synthetase [Plasmodium berghei ANKA]CXI61654.1 glutathione synthetase [Plasmodium berghei]SCM23656.1 glutathione synthetase [Plasmodium berghei]SCN26709.1 glutathione synthetase [Plasmodium berghei]SCO61006.1 glutathione synthetase [Plasmodium berghei]SCO63107.1 glutathione synthetase [Plasmodium berghei]|eukprot:XP_034422325.1 glutathione synthetase [Plasmodium berghei ANKA]